MATVTGVARAAAQGRSAPPAGRPNRAQRWIADHLVVLYAGLALFYLFLPVIVVFIFSFNTPAGRYNFQWNHFSLNAWRNVCGVPGMCDAVALSLRVALLATVISTVMGTLIAFALVRHRFRGRASTNLLIFQPMATPEVVMGSSLLALFVQLQIQPGFATILIAHILFCISFVVITVKARLQGLDPRLEQAAMDLYANEWQTFRRVTLPLVMPGILAAALLAFSLSFDDFIITNFNSGSRVTFPLFVFGANQRGTPPQINVIGALMFLAALLLVFVSHVAGRRRATH